MNQAVEGVRQRHIPRLFIVADRPLQRIALAEMVQSCGYDIIENLPPDRLLPQHLLQSPDLWLLDVVDQEEILEKIGFDAPVMFGIDPAPQLTDRHAYGRWVRVLSRKLIKLLGHPPPLLSTDPPPAPSISVATPQTDWRYVCVLGASMGGPNAVKTFLDQLPSHLPIAILYVQHIDPYMQELLPRILVRQNNWRSQLVKDEPVMLRAGEIFIVPATRLLDIQPSGLLTPLDGSWPGAYQPSINEVLLRASQALTDRLIAIMFSGMGDDGSEAVAQVVRYGGQVWAQTANTCDCSSQPDAVRATGLVNFNGSPETLAQKLQVFLELQTMERAK